MRRRSFLAKLFGGTVAITTVSQLQAITPEATVQEIKPQKKYLVKINNCPPDICKNFEDYLRASGLDIIVVSGPFELYEIEKKES
jgi:hypothetical protein